MTAFVVANVLIDLESVVNLVTGRHPVHAELHTFAASLGVGVVAGVAVALVGRWRRRRDAEWAVRPALAGGVAGGLGQPLLDGIMHGDIRPFLPVTADNPLFRIIGLDALHTACLVTGAVGAAWLAWRWSSRAKAD